MLDARGSRLEAGRPRLEAGRCRLEARTRAWTLEVRGFRLDAQGSGSGLYIWGMLPSRAAFLVIPGHLALQERVFVVLAGAAPGLFSVLRPGFVYVGQFWRGQARLPRGLGGFREVGQTFLEAPEGARRLPEVPPSSQRRS